MRDAREREVGMLLVRAVPGFSIGFPSRFVTSTVCRGFFLPRTLVSDELRTIRCLIASMDELARDYLLY